MKKKVRNTAHTPKGCKEHQFLLVVKTYANRRSAELAVLSAFGLRKPDDCEFYLRSASGHKQVWMAGALAGTETAFDLVMRSLEKLQERLLKSKK